MWGKNVVNYLFIVKQMHVDCDRREMLTMSMVHIFVVELTIPSSKRDATDDTRTVH